MAENDDVQSEHAPEGWTSMFNRFSGDAQDSAATSGRKSDKNPTIESTGWFGGLLGTKAGSRKSSISSDTPPVVESNSGSDVDEDPSMKKLKGEEAENEDSGVDNSSDVDSDGFPIEREHEREKSESVSVSSKRSSGGSSKVEQVMAELVEEEVSENKPSPRRERVRNRLNFTINQSASETAVPDEIQQPQSINEAAPKGQLNAVDAPQVSATTAVPSQAPEPVAWWQGLFPVASDAPPQLPEAPSSKESDQKIKENPDTTRPIEGGAWSNMFGPSKNSEEEARKLLPVITAPPSIDALWESNSYYCARPQERSAEIFGPRPLMSFSGRVRGWPRRFAPQWSTDGTQETHQVNRRGFSSVSSVNGASALAMFRVT